VQQLLPNVLPRNLEQVGERLQEDLVLLVIVALAVGHAVAALIGGGGAVTVAAGHGELIKNWNRQKQKIVVRRRISFRLELGLAAVVFSRSIPCDFHYWGLQMLVTKLSVLVF
jgi:hypothetical protein